MSRAVRWWIGALAACGAPSLSAQSALHAYDVTRLDGARFIETIHSDVITQSGTATVQRTIDRTAIYTFRLLGDTIQVTADSLALRETVDGSIRDADVDAVIGARWKLLRDVQGRVRVVDRPFVPDAIADVSDIGTAMDDFFPAAVPRVAVGTRMVDSVARTWTRPADSAGHERLRWSFSGRMDSTRAGLDSAVTPPTGSVHDNGQLVWDALRGPLAWHREVDTDLDTRVRGRALRGSVHQRIDVRRLRDP